MAARRQKHSETLWNYTKVGKSDWEANSYGTVLQINYFNIFPLLIFNHVNSSSQVASPPTPFPQALQISIPVLFYGQREISVNLPESESVL